MALWIEISLFTFSLISGNVNADAYPQNLIESRRSIRLYSGYATHRPLMAIVSIGDIRPEYHGTGINGLDISQKIASNWKGYPIDWSIRLGFLRHQENGFQPNHNQVNGLIMVHYRTQYNGFPIRLFIGEGLSYSEQIPYVEGRETRRLSDERDSQLMNYINIGFDFNLGDMFQNPSLTPITIGFADYHRSGIYKKIKLFNRTQGGSNFISIFLEYNF
ncbi:MAG: hypothetical protein ISR82_04305 [Candidatus Marinimicrobia bacterium]|nr:hypothetical protein [Candidatus Neomarinimicrobiota bacterium]MBL7010423.1 hypothetical protein [Candidatus Neomarinimicrobiota bacterium]MBL7030725.1 hypothetical protein [Candidatus Neomarinimicrobiota bacterium]